MMTRLIVLLALLLAPTLASAQDAEPLLPGSKGYEKPPEPEPLPERKVAPSEAAPADDSEAAPEEEMDEADEPPPAAKPVDTRPKRGSFDGSLQIGPAAVSMPGTDTSTGFAPAFMAGHRSSFLMSSQFGLRWSSKFVLHDFEAIGDYYGWYNKGSSEDVKAKYLLLWPGLLFGPFIGANYGTGLGMVVYTSPTNPSLYFDFGLGFELFLNPSDPCFLIDVGLSADFSIGLDFNDAIGMGATVSWGFPFFHGLFDGDGDDIPSVIVYLSIL